MHSCRARNQISYIHTVGACRNRGGHCNDRPMPTEQHIGFPQRCSAPMQVPLLLGRSTCMTVSQQRVFQQVQPCTRTPAVFTDTPYAVHHKTQAVSSAENPSDDTRDLTITHTHRRPGVKQCMLEPAQMSQTLRPVPRTPIPHLDQPFARAIPDKGGHVKPLSLREFKSSETKSHRAALLLRPLHPRASTLLLPLLRRRHDLSLHAVEHLLARSRLCPLRLQRPRLLLQQRH